MSGRRKEKVRRHWAGRGGEEEEEEKVEEVGVNEGDIGEKEGGRVIASSVVVRRGGGGDAGGDAGGEGGGRGRDSDVEERERKGGVTSGQGEEEDEEEDEETIARRRARARARALEQEDEDEDEDAFAAFEDDGADDTGAMLKEEDNACVDFPDDEEREKPEEEESSEYETDDSDDEEARLLKPMFVPKAARATIAERDRLEEEARDEEVREKARSQQRREETKELVGIILEEERRFEEQARAEIANAGGYAGKDEVKTDDDEEDMEEFAAWEERERERILRDRRWRREAEAKKASSTRNASRTKAERAEEEARKDMEAMARLQAERSGKDEDGQKWKYMQRYYHQGAFFQEKNDDKFGTVGTHEIYSRDYASAPTGEDKIDKASLPKVMQVRNFGKIGRTKWTNLRDEDTTYYGREKKKEEDRNEMR